MKFNNKKIIVIGASGGIGETVCKKLSDEGATLIMVARDNEKLNSIKAELKGDGHRIYCFDLCDINGIEGLIKKIVKEEGKIDSFVHCAGISYAKPLKLANYEFVHKNMLVNFYSFYEFVRIFSNKRYNTGNGSIVVMSSIASKRGDKAQSAYAASKGAIDSAIKVLAKELAEKGLRINSIVAGMINTKMFEGFTQKNDNSILSELLQKQYIGIIEPTDIADAIIFLLSDSAKFITGTGFVIDGGFLT